ncbi:MAG: hypothetical protein ACREYE_00780 [Gammaproteobacteria bacterium]
MNKKLWLIPTVFIVTPLGGRCDRADGRASPRRTVVAGRASPVASRSS